MQDRFLSTDELRELFLNFFQNEGYDVMPSFSLVPENDPSILLINSGMAPFKNFFLEPEKALKKKITTVQKCVRVGGKHNDLAEVGVTDRHLTFFEMCGSFDFSSQAHNNSSLKEEILSLCYRFLIQKAGLKKDKMFFTYFPGDNDTLDILKKITLLEDKHFRVDEDNMWSMANTGPCGYCTEIYYELNGQQREIWNIVFMSQTRTLSGDYVPLPSMCIDTGMGLERLAAAVQGVNSVFEIDTNKKLFAKIQELTGCNDKITLSVITDHARTLVMLLEDGIIPSHTGRGYIFQRIARRALIFAYRDRSIHRNKWESILSDLVDSIVDVLKTGYPTLVQNIPYFKKVIRGEEERFLHLITKIEPLIQSELNLSQNLVLKGETAFKLYSTYGVPIELITDLGISVDLQGFEACLNESRSKNADFQLYADIEALPSEFQGYDRNSIEGRVEMIYCSAKNGQYQPVDILKSGQEGIIILNQTSLFPSSGGQMGDKGTIVNSFGSFAVSHTIYKGRSILHLGHVNQGSIHLHKLVVSEYDEKTRNSLTANHSATHLLHAALLKLYGPSIRQKGSSVQESKLTFDFNDPGNPSILDLEKLVNKYISQKIDTQIEYISREEADVMNIPLNNILEDKVRILKIGDVSIEACCGTHVRNTQEIGIFRILRMKNIASGIKRITAYTDQAHSFLDIVHEYENLLDVLVRLTKARNYKDIETKLRSLLAEKNNLKTDNIRAQEDIFQLQYEKYTTVCNRVSITQLKLNDLYILNHLVKIHLQDKQLVYCFINPMQEKNSVYLIANKTLNDYLKLTNINILAQSLKGSVSYIKDVIRINSLILDKEKIVSLMLSFFG